MKVNLFAIALCYALIERGYLLLLLRDSMNLAYSKYIVKMGIGNVTVR